MRTIITESLDTVERERERELLFIQHGKHQTSYTQEV